MLTKAQIKRQWKKIPALFYRMKLKNRDFSILSNNCWGGSVYDKYALPYRTPTIGLWIPPADYIRFLENVDHYLSQDMQQIHYSESHVADLLEERKKSGRYAFELDSLVIGRIDDVDLIFIHYHTFSDAKNKWDRRKTRLNKENLIVKMNDQNGCTEDDFHNFLSLNYKNKLFFTAKKEWADNEGVVLLEQYQSQGYVVSDTSKGDVPLDTTQLLNAIKE